MIQMICYIDILTQNRNGTAPVFHNNHARILIRQSRPTNIFLGIAHCLKSGDSAHPTTGSSTKCLPPFETLVTLHPPHADLETRFHTALEFWYSLLFPT